MSTTFVPTTTNPHIAALETLFRETRQPVQWLVIAHPDSQMLRSLSATLTGESAALLEIPQNLEDFRGDRLRETIEWALQHGDIKHLVFAGSALAGHSESQASLLASEPNNRVEGDYAKLLAGVQLNNARNREIQKRFAADVQHMLQLDVVQDRLSNGELAVHALFYRAECGLFLAYDAEVDTFSPLVA